MTITAGSDRAAEEFFNNTRRRVDHIIPAGLDPEALAASEGITERPIDILGVGSLIPIKDFHSFIAIVTVLSRDHPQLRCVIIGDGPERSSLQLQTEEHGLQEVVRFAGHVPREEVLSTMRKAKILLHTSLYEGQGYVFLEALAAGMRVVCRDVGYTGNATGVYRCRSTDEMTSALERALTMPIEERKLRIESVDDTAQAFEEIYGIFNNASTAASTFSKDSPV
jgi:glycosyltransferase involved in cell wall biosynthesis